MNQAVAKHQETPAPQVVSGDDAVISMIERAARDPQVDLDKMQRLIDMRGQMQKQEAERQFDQAMTDAQGEMRAVAADANNPQTKSKYASYFALDKVLRPIYTKHGFSMSFNTGTGAPEQHVRILCRVAHKAGHSRDYSIDMPADGKGAKGGDVMTKTHATGSALTYGQRYLLKMIFNIAVGGDDDGNAASSEPITEEQVGKLQSLIVEVAADIGRFCKYMKVDRIEKIPAREFEHAVAALEGKRKPVPA